MKRIALLLAGSLVGLSTVVSGHAGASPQTAVSRDLPGTHCTPFPANNVWNTPVNTLPVNKRSAEWVKHIGVRYQGQPVHTHPDFGPSYGAQPVPYGIPITYVSGSHPLVHVRFRYASESDKVKYPLGNDTKIEGGRHADGDRHAIVVDKATCRDYETWLTVHDKSGWTAGSGATWSLNSNHLRPAGWTSADAAGLPILPGLLRWNEVKAGHVDHAIRFTAPITSKHYIWPARHEAGSKASLAYPPMGARFRLKASYHLKGASKYTKVVLTAMKTYGLILADNGSPWYFQGEQSTHWPGQMIAQLKEIPASAFVAVDESGLRVSANSAQAR